MNDVASSSNPPPPAPVLSSAPNLAPGFRFHPTDEELVSYYLKRKVCNLPIRVDAIAEVELYKREPWDLPAASRLRSRDMEWYFFSPLDRKYSNRSRTNRATAQGYWKTTGKDRAVRSGERGERVVGMKKTLVFHFGRAPRGERTNWVMHEYRLEDENLALTGVPQDAYVVCRIFQKSGSGPRNGAQYGAPFVEEEWEDADDLVVAMADAGDSGDSGETGDEENVDVTSVRGAIPVAVGGENGYLQLSDFENKYDQGIQCENNGILAISSDGLNNSNNSEDPIFLVADEIFQGQGCTYGMGVPGLQDVQTSYDGMGGNANLALQYHSPASENDGYVEVNDIIDTVKMEYPSTEDSFGFYIDTSVDRQIPMNQVDGTISFPEVHGNEFFDAVNGNGEPHDIFEMNSGPDLFLEPDEFLNDLPGDYLPEDNMLFYDAPTNDEPLLEDNFLQMHDLYSPPADSSGLNVDDLMAYFDCTENSLHYSTEESLEKCLYPPSNESVAKVEGSTVPTVTSHSLTSAVDVGASSSSRLPQPNNLSNDMTEKGVAATDSQKGDMSFPKRLASMLGSFSAPPALAAESPGPRGKSIGPASSSGSVGSVHVTAGVIQIHGYNMVGRAEHWSSQKHGDMGLLLSFGVARNVFGKSEDYEPVPKVQGWSMSVVLRGGFYLFFLSALFLAVSLKVGLHICSR